MLFICSLLRLTILLFSLCLFNSLSAEKISNQFFAKSNFKSKPAFIEKTDPALVDDGKQILIGNPTNLDTPGVFLYDLKSQKQKFFAPPLREYFQENSQYLQEGSTNPGLDAFPIFIEQLLFYSEEEGKAGFLVENSNFKLPIKKFLFVAIDLASNIVEYVEEVAETPRQDPETYVMSLYIGNGKFIVYEFPIGNNQKGTKTKVRVFEYKDMVLNLRHNYDSRLLPYRPKLDISTNKLFIASYAEGSQNLNPTGRMLDLSTNEFWDSPIPKVPYGVCFSPDGKFVFLASAETGEFIKIDVATGKTLQKAKLGKMGHAMGFWKENEILWVRNSGIDIINPTTMKVTKTIPTKKYFKGIVNVSGSTVIPMNSVILRNIFGSEEKGTEFLHIFP